METIKLIKLEYNKNAEQVYPAQVQALKNELKQHYTDLIVISHGWNNNDAEALDMYKKMLELISNEISKRKLSARKFLAVGIIWPSKKFGDPATGGAAAAVGTSSQKEALISQCKALEASASKEEVKLSLSKIIKLLSTNAKPQPLSEAFTDLFNALIEGDGIPSEKQEEAFPEFNSGEIKLMLTDSGYWEDNLPKAGTGGANKVGSLSYGGSMSIFSGLTDGVQNLLNLTTYYMMKSRSGLIGRKGLNPVLSALKKEFKGLKIHLIGHSFGARLVSSAVMGEEKEDQIEVNSLSLLQAAFSHYAFAKSYKGKLDGLFRAVIEKHLVKDAFIITHSRKDKAVGIAYAVASRLAGQIASAVGDKNDPYGGLGGNGAQVTPEAVQLELLDAKGKYTFQSDKVYNLESEKFICGHSDIRKTEVANALVSAFG